MLFSKRHKLSECLTTDVVKTGPLSFCLEWRTTDDHVTFEVLQKVTWYGYGCYKYNLMSTIFKITSGVIPELCNTISGNDMVQMVGKMVISVLMRGEGVKFG